MGQKIGHDQENQEQEIELDSKEKVVRNACPDAKIRTIRRLLKKYKGDPNKVIDVIFASTIDNEADQMPKEIMDTTSKGKTPEEAEQEPSIPKKNLDDDNVASEETVITIDSLEDNAPSLLPEETIVKPKKKLSAAERKKEAKKRQKENKMLKDRAKAARKVSYKHEEESSSTSAVTQSMKEMHI
jgi:OTU domain-containing protein 3